MVTKRFESWSAPQVRKAIARGTAPGNRISILLQALKGRKGKTIPQSLSNVMIHIIFSTLIFRVMWRTILMQSCII